MVKAFFSLLVFCGLFFFSPLNIHAQAPRTASPLSGSTYNYSGPWYPGQDVTHCLYQWELDKLVAITALKLGTDPTKIWIYYFSGDISIYAGKRPGVFEVIIWLNNSASGGISIVLEEVI